MRVLLAGGGNAEQSKKIDEFYMSSLSTRHIAYFPQAAVPKMFDLEYAEKWLKDRPAFTNVQVNSFLDLTKTSFDELQSYETLFISGGNTFDLLDKFNQSGFLPILRRLASMDKIIYGASAGAIVLGSDILSAGIGPEADSNDTDMTNFEGANLLHGYNVLTHYKEDYEELVKTFAKDQHAAIIAIPEEGGVFFDGSLLTNISSTPVYVVSQQGALLICPDEVFRITNCT